MRSPTQSPERLSRHACVRQPVVWLGGAIFLASIAGCVLLIVLGATHADPPVPTPSGEILKVPLSRVPADQTDKRG
jgi:hypothetical protein